MRETNKEQENNEKQENNAVSGSITGDTVVCAQSGTFEGRPPRRMRGCAWCKGARQAKIQADAFRHRDRQVQSHGGWQEQGVSEGSSEVQGGWGL